MGDFMAAWTKDDHVAPRQTGQMPGVTVRRIADRSRVDVRRCKARQAVATAAWMPRLDALYRLVFFQFFRRVDLHQFQFDATGLFLKKGDPALWMHVAARHVAGRA